MKRFINISKASAYFGITDKSLLRMYVYASLEYVTNK